MCACAAPGRMHAGWVTRLLIKAVYIPKEYEEELRGLSDATGLDYTTLLSLNVGYE